MYGTWPFGLINTRRQEIYHNIGAYIDTNTVTSSPKTHNKISSTTCMAVSPETG